HVRHAKGCINAVLTSPYEYLSAIIPSLQNNYLITKQRQSKEFQGIETRNNQINYT
ncbi:10801_t:CDS:1, partial [Funneliformis geosporum]